MAEGWTHSLQFQGEAFALEDGETTVGRSRTCHVTVNDPSVSRRHVVLVPGDGHVVVRDLGSSNGSFINERRVQAEAVVENGDVLRLGDAELTVVIQGPADGPRPVEPTAETALPQHGEATFFLQAESMKLAEGMEAGGPSAAEFKMPERPSGDAGSPSAMPVPPSAASPSAMPVPPPADGGSPSAMPIPSAMPVPPPVDAPVTLPPSMDAGPPSLDTQRLDINALGLQDPVSAAGAPAAGAPPVDAPVPATTQRLEIDPALYQGTSVPEAPSTGNLSAEDPASTQRLEIQPPAAPEAFPAGMKTTAISPEQLEAMRRQTPPSAPPAPPEPPVSSMQTTAMSAEQLDALRAEAEASQPAAPQPAAPQPAAPPPAAPQPAAPPQKPSPTEAPQKPRTAEELMALPPRQFEQKRPHVAPFAPDGTPGATAIEIPSVPDLDVASEQSIMGMPMPQLIPEADAEMPSVPDIAISSEQSIVGMAAAPLEPEFYGEAPAVPDIPLEEEEAPPAPPAQTPSPAPAPAASVPPPSDGPSFDTGDAFPSFDDGPSFETGDALPSFEIPGEDAEPSFEIPGDDAGPSFEIPGDDAPGFGGAPTFDAPAGAPPAPGPSFGLGGDATGAVSFGDLDASSKFEIKNEVAPPGGVPAPAPPPSVPEPSVPEPSVPEPSAAPAPPSAGPAFEEPGDFAPPELEIFDAPIPAGDDDFGAFDAPQPELFDPGVPEPPEMPLAEVPSVPPSFDAVTPPAAPPSADGAFSQPTPAAAPPPENQEMLERQPVSSLLPSLDDITSSVGPPEMRPPSQPAVETEAFKGVAAAAGGQTAPLPAVDPGIPAGPGIRLIAFLIDLALIAGLGVAARVALPDDPLLWAVGAGAAMGFLILFFGWTLAGSSPGKWACRLAIRNAVGSRRLGPIKALLRLLTFGFGFLTVPFGADRRGLHDRIAGTTVYRM